MVGGFDTLQLIDPDGGFPFGNVIYNSTDANSGSVEFVTFGEVFYEGLEPVQDLTTASIRTFNAPALGNDNIVRECATLHIGTTGGGGVTRIGHKNLFMAYSHVAHDCVVGQTSRAVACPF